jgi:hypothetical protein
MRVLASLAVVSVTLSIASVAAAQQPKVDKDLLDLGESVLPQDTPAPKPGASARPAGPRAPAAKPSAAHSAAAPPSSAAPAAAPVGAVPDASAASAAGPADADVDAEADADVDAAGEADAAPAASTDSTLDAAVQGDAAEVASAAPDESKPDAGAPPKAPVALGRAARQARIDSGQNLPLSAPAESPLAHAGVPVEAVPAVATAATVGTMAIWPLLIKTLTGLLKSVFGGFLKSRAKKGQKLDKEQKTIHVMGFAMRPAELLWVLVGALVYGFAVCYAFQGKKLQTSFLVSQEALVVVIYYTRSAVRLTYQRVAHLTTQYKFWLGGGLLCLGSAYLGTTLATVGYELEETKGPEDAERVMKMKVWLLVIALLMAYGFAAANVLSPAKIFQSGRVMMTGAALAEILPITPMPGKKIMSWRPGVWALLAVAVVTSFIVLNFVL